METCFVIQPFDGGGKFDKRYEDIYSPAIKAANLIPYRVDRDPSVNIPIEDIEKEISAPTVSFTRTGTAFKRWLGCRRTHTTSQRTADRPVLLS